MRPAAGIVLATLIGGACPVPAHAINWSISTVDGAPNSGWDTTLRLDSVGNPRVAYWTPGTGIRIATLTGSGWTYETFPGPDVPASSPPELKVPFSPEAAPARTELLITDVLDMAIDPVDQPWIAHARINCFTGCTGMLRLSHRVGTTWFTEDVEPVNSRPSIEVGSDGRVHLCYGSSSGSLKHATRDTAGQWTSEVIGTSSGGVMRLDAANEPHVVWLGVAPYCLWYSYRVNGLWQATAIDSGGNYTLPSLTLAPSGEARIAFGVHSWPRAGLWYAEQNGTSWEKSLVSGGINAATSPSIAVDPAGDPIIPYNDQTDLDLLCASRKHGIWTIDTVDAQGNTGYWPSIVVNAAGRPLVAYNADASLGTRMAAGTEVLAAEPIRAPVAFALRLFGPNPSVDDRSLRFALDSPAPTEVSLEVFDVGGRTAASRARWPVGAGTTTIQWEAGLTHPGVYFVRAFAATGSSAVVRVAVIH